MVCGKNGVFWETVNCKDIQTRNSILKHHFLAKKDSPVSFQDQLWNEKISQKETSLSILVTSEEVARQIKAAND